MSLSATLKFGDNTTKLYSSQSYKVTECKFRVYRNHNAYMPTTDVRCDKIEITVVAPGKEDRNLVEWYIDETFLNGLITIDLSDRTIDDKDLFRELTFDNAQCFSIGEEYHIDNNGRRLLKMEIVADMISIDGVVFNRF